MPTKSSFDAIACLEFHAAVHNCRKYQPSVENFAFIVHSLAPSRNAAWAAASRAIGTRNGEQLT